MKLSALLAVVAVAGSTAVTAEPIRVIHVSDASAELFSSPPFVPVAPVTVHKVPVASFDRPTKLSIWDILGQYGLVSKTGGPEAETIEAHQHKGYHGHHHAQGEKEEGGHHWKHHSHHHDDKDFHSEKAMREDHHKETHGVAVSSTGWMASVLSMGSPVGHVPSRLPNEAETRYVEAMMAGKVPEEEPQHGHHGHGHHGFRGQHQRPKCFRGRLFKAIRSLRPYEAFFLAFTVGAGLGSLLRTAWLLIILAKRSHAYLNESPVALPASASSDAAAEGYPGAAYKVKVDEKRTVVRDEETAELLGLPAYQEKEASVVVEDEKTQSLA